MVNQKNLINLTKFIHRLIYRYSVTYDVTQVNVNSTILIQMVTTEKLVYVRCLKPPRGVDLLVSKIRKLFNSLKNWFGLNLILVFLKCEFFTYTSIVGSRYNHEISVYDNMPCIFPIRCEFIVYPLIGVSNWAL